MLFNSYIFTFLFLPVAVVGFYALTSTGRMQTALGWLVVCSLCFYGWWNPRYLLLIGASMAGNYGCGLMMARRPARSTRGLLTLGIAANLALLGYYKYAGFFVANVNWLAGTQYGLGRIVLPLAISFFTFQQITYLVDAYRGETREYSFVHYCLFVTFFPQLIAGPIVHHSEMLPQFARPDTLRPHPEHLAVGLTIFAVGLFKKTVIADSAALASTPVFHAALLGYHPTFMEAWAGALGYTFQLYFDFSGYSDMAVGLARLFGIRLPMNFNSPYKATSIVEFWQRWHMTLSRFLRDYLYIPLGGNRKGTARRYLNLMVTMVLGGLWHGAGWTFVVWGALHGVYLLTNHAWRALSGHRKDDATPAPWWQRWACRLLTFFAVVVAWVFFRAETFTSALSMLGGMVGLNGFVLPANYLMRYPAVGLWLQAHGWQFVDHMPTFRGSDDINLVVELMILVWAFPNIYETFVEYRPHFYSTGDAPAVRGLTRLLRWRPDVRRAVAYAAMMFVALHYIQRSSEFLYFQF